MRSICDTVARNLAQVEERIVAACERSGRSREAVTLVAVTKTCTLDQVRAAYDCGLRDVGENRPEELLLRIEALAGAYDDDPLRWHMIGHVQGRKVPGVVAAADVLHSLDSLRLAQRLQRFVQEGERKLPVMVQLNVSGEASKEGWPAWSDELLDETISLLAGLEHMPHLVVLGLMTLAPYVADPEQARPVFRRLRQAQALIQQRLPFAAWSELSMGMTNDYEVAIEEGATMVRIGRAIFGERW